MTQKILHGAIIGIIICIILAVFYLLGFFKTFNTSLSDNLFTNKNINGNILIIAIDDKSIGQIGRWPWDRSVHSRLLDILSQENNRPKSIGFDISFFEPGNNISDNQFAQSLKKSGNVTLAAENNKQLLVPIEEFSQSTSLGVVNISLDSDSVSRKVPTENTGNITPFYLSVIKNYDQNFNLPASDKPIRISYSGKPGTFPYISFSDILNGNIDPSIFKDKIVLIGATAPNLHDAYTTPMSNGIPMPGVEVHANIINTILNNDFISDESQILTVFTFAIIALVLSIIFSLLGIIPAIILVVVSIIIYLFYVIFSFDNNILRNIIYPILAIILSAIANIAYKYLTENKQKEFIKKAFSYYLSESVLNKIMSDPSMLKLGGERKEVTVLFSDIAGFTTISEKIDPEKLTQLLNMYLTQMTNIVLQNEGVLDKYIGDAVMAFWGAPLDQEGHALLACKTALGMYKKIPGIAKEWKKEGIESFDIRIGIHTGNALVGNMGSETRFDYTVLGDTVNTASRLEGINKEYKTHITISEATYQKVKKFVKARKLDVVKVKGKTKGVQIYELLNTNN